MTSSALVGIDSCPIEGFIKKSRSFIERKVCGYRQIRFVLMVAFGYRKADPANPKSRRNTEDIITWM
jgi:nitroreductase